jgi:predicted nucleic acid-binding protein
VSPAVALELLKRISDVRGHELWTEGLDQDNERAGLSTLLIMGHRQLTDAYLLALAASRGGILATLDGRIASLIRKGSPLASSFIVVPV